MMPLILKVLILLFLVAFSDSSNITVSSSATHRNVSSPPPAKPRNHNRPGIVTAATVERTAFYVNLILKPIICFSGLVMNVIGCFVLLHKSLRHSSYRYLLGLLIADCGFLLCGILRMPTDISAEYDIMYSNYLSSVLDIPTKHYIELAFSKVSAITICILALERLIAISFPLKAKTFFLARYSGKISVALFFMVFMLYVPKLFQTHFVWSFNRPLNRSAFIIQKITYSEPTLSFMTNYDKFVFNILMIYITPCLLLVLNIGIWVQLAVIRRRRKFLFGTAEQEQWKVTLTLMTISVFFVVVYIPLISVNVLEIHNPRRFSRRGPERHFRSLVNHLSSLGWTINSANDFIIYVITNVKFRVTLTNMFCSKKAQRDNVSTNTPSLDQHGQ
ncbi:uncharacterized protein LOC124256603 [Haliotis rubra]|uniref:uncharacterized protein LOC124256603 n=1 Tax=Haliotis rubra TaxID=36100 RepID=UPI001EE59BC4|nr:uncharacterized protein LOC124256603 [Haliotis rubra]